MRKINTRDPNAQQVNNYNNNVFQQLSEEAQQGAQIGFEFGNVTTPRDKLGEDTGRDLTGARQGYYGRSIIELLDSAKRDNVTQQLGDKFGVSNLKWNDLTSAQQAGIGAGAIAGDTISYGTRHYLWNVFPPDLVGTWTANEFTDRGYDRTWRNLGRVGSVEALNLLSANYALGNLAQGGRPEGFKAISAEEDDPRESTNPTYDMIINRGLLGRRGSLLPWEHFQQERPDVSYDEYKEYRDYLYNEEEGPLSTASLGLVKGTWDGINNVPELSVMGFTIQPQGVLGAVGAAAGIGVVHDEMAKNNTEMRLNVEETKLKNELTDFLPHKTGLEPGFIRDMAKDKFRDGTVSRAKHIEDQLVKRYSPETALKLKTRSTIDPRMSDLEYISYKTQELGEKETSLRDQRLRMQAERAEKNRLANNFRTSKDVKGRLSSLFNRLK